MNTPVILELAKLLKEKGFPQITDSGWVEQAPIAEVVMWLYEKHGIWIQPFPYDTITAAKEWTVTVLSLEWGEDKEVHYENKIGGFNSPTEAYEAAILYTLNNLI